MEAGGRKINALTIPKNKPLLPSLSMARPPSLLAKRNPSAPRNEGAPD